MISQRGLPLADAGPSVLVLVVVPLVAYLAVLWVALAFWVVRDSRRRSPSLLFAGFAAVLGFMPPFLGAFVYLVIRPPRTLEEDRTLQLEERALAESLAGEAPPRPCPSCGREIDPDFVLCPYCRTQFARRCQGCRRSLRLGWPVCPYCAEDVGTQHLPRAPRAVSSP